MVKKFCREYILGIAIGIAILMLFVGNANAIPSEEWNKTFRNERVCNTPPSCGEEITSVQQTLDGGFILAGYTSELCSNCYYGLLIKTDSRGNKQWSKIFDFPVDSVRQTSDGGYIVAITESTNDPNYITAALLIKTDIYGNKQWSKRFGSITVLNYPNYNANSVQQTSDGGYILAGGTYSYTSGNFDAWFVKTDSNGNVQWSKTYGGVRQDNINSVQQTNDGSYILAGWTKSYGAGGNDVWIIKTDSLGNKLWSKTFGGTNDDSANSIRQTLEGGYILTGVTSSYGGGGSDAWLIKTDSLGNKQWSKTFGGTNDDSANSIRQTLEGGYILAGWTESYGAGGSDAWLIKTDSLGNKQWSKTFGGTHADFGYSVQQTKDGGYILAGSHYIYYPEDWDGSAGWLIKLKTESVGIIVTSPNGGENWVRGTTKTLKWTYAGNPGTYIKIELFKGGLFNKLIASAVPIGSSGLGSYNWYIPTTQTLGNDYKIKVTSTSNSIYTDMSNNNFAIGNPYIIVTSPNGGENWARGTTKTITWKKDGNTGNYVKIDLYKAGVFKQTIVSSTPNDGSHSWTIPSTQTLGSDYKIKITSTSNSAYTDMSNNNFRIH